MASKYSRFNYLYPIIAEWSALGSFVLLGDLTAQKLEHHFNRQKPKPEQLPSTTPTVPTVAAPTHSSMHSHEHLICKKEKMHHIIIATTSDDNEEDDDTAFHLDYTRLLAAACTGLLWVAPICMLWFPFLHRFMAKHCSHLIEGSFRYVSTKVIIENVCLAAPICVGYFVIPAVIEGGDDWWSMLVARLETDFVSTLVTDVSFWCAASPFNYKFIPVRYGIVRYDTPLQFIVYNVCCRCILKRILYKVYML